MTDALFDIVFAGRLADGADPAAVRNNLAKLFKADAARIEGLLSGDRVIIRKAIDTATARNYLAALAKAGAIAEMVAAGGQTSVNAAPAASPPSHPAPAALTIAEPGVLIVEQPPRYKAEFNTAHLTLAEVGVTLIEPTRTTPPQFNLGTLSLAPAGALFPQAQKPTPAKFDTSKLTLTEPK